MGGSSSKLELPEVTAPTQEEILSHSTVSAEYAQKIAEKAAETQAAAIAAAQQAAADLESATFWFRAKLGGGLFIVLAFAAVLVWYFVWGPGHTPTPPGPPTPATLTVTSATYGGKDVTSSTIAKVSGDTLSLASPISTSLGVTGCTGSACTSVYNITYTFTDEPNKKYGPNYDETSPVNINKNNRGTPLSTDKALPPAQGTSMLSRLQSYFTGSGDSGDHLPNAKVATAPSSIPASSAPISAKNGGAYGYQWWMYIDNWDHNYGKEKSVLVRADPSNTNIVNPSVTLHPTENNLDVSVSVYEGGNSTTGDTFTCSVRDVPLQAWFAVSVTLFGRNLDVYLNGKLVKSCVLPGVPKTVSGDIQLNSGNGFAGYMSNLYTYSRMLTPSDAQAFYSAGTPSSALKNVSPTLASAMSGNYSLKFGIENASGKVVDSYTF